VCKVFVETLILEEVRPVSIKACMTLGNCGHRRDEVSRLYKVSVRTGRPGPYAQ